MSASLTSIVKQSLPHITSLRRELHRHPELGYEEKRTCEIVCRELKKLGVKHIAGLAGGTGVLAHIPATESGSKPRTIALRADMDALPITEQTGKEYTSENSGVMHACGHDGHTSILLGTARALTQLKERRNHVKLIFQPAEEGGAGGDRMCRDGVLTDRVLGPKVDMIYGLHGWPELELGQVATRIGPLLAATDEFDITIHGKGCHAAYPHFGIDPIVVASHIVTALQTIVSRNVGPLESMVITVGMFHAGNAHNVIPDTASIAGTLRTLTPENRAWGEQRIHEISSGIAASFGARAEVNWSVGYPTTVNDAAATERFRTVAREALGAQRVLDRDHPTMGGEDFSFYGQHVPACFFLLGLRPPSSPTYPNLHTPVFDFNDDALPIAVEMMSRLALAEV